MPTLTGQPQTGAAKVEQRLSQELAQATSRIRTADLISGGLILIVLALVYTLAVIVADSAFELPAAARVFGLLAFALVCAVTAWRLVVRPLRASVNPRFAARQVELTVEGGKNAVINWVDLRDRDLPASVRAAVGAKAAEGVAAADVARVGESRRNLWLLGIAATLVATLAVAFLVLKSSVFFSLLNRAYNPFSAGTIATRTSLTVEEPLGGDTTVTSSEPLTIRVSVGGAIPDPKSPERVRLLVRYNPDAAEFEEMPLDRGESSRDFAAKLPPSVVQNGFRYRVAAGDATTPEFIVTVRTRPLLRDFAVKYDYPEYTRLRGEVTADPRIEAVRGTRVTLTAHANRAVKDAKLVLDTQLTQLPGVPGTDGPESVAFSFPLEESSNYRISWTATDGETAESAAYPIRVTPDVAPRVVISAPKEEEVTLPADGLLKVDGIAADDYGVSAVTLQLRLAGTPAVPLQPLKYLAGKSFKREADESFPMSVETKQSVKLAELKTVAGQPAAIREGSVIEYWLEAKDNCAVPSANVGRSKVQRVKVGRPTPPEAKPKQAEQTADRKQQEQQHAERQAEQQADEKRPPKQPRPDNVEPKPGEQKPDKGQEGQPQDGQPKPGEGDPKPGHEDKGQPKKADPTKPNEGDPKPKDGNPKPNEGEPKEQNPEGGQPGNGAQNGEKSATGEPKSPEGTKPPKGGQPDQQPAGSDSSDKPAEEQSPQDQPKSNGNAGQPQPPKSGDNSATGEKSSRGGAETPQDKQLQKQAEQIKKALQNENQPENNKSPEPQPGEAKPQPKPGEGANPDAGNKPEPQPGGEQSPGQPKPSEKSGGDQPKPGTPEGGTPKPGQEKATNPSANAGDKPEPKQGESGGRPTPQSDNRKSPDAKEIEQAVRDLKSDNPEKQQAAREKLDNAMGKANREAAEKKAEQLEKDLQSGDPKKQDAARKEIEDIAKKAEAAQKAAGEKGGDPQEKPSNETKSGEGTKPESKAGEGKPMTPEPNTGDGKSTDTPKEGAEDRGKPEPQPGGGGKTPDAKEIEQAVRDLKSGDPAKQQAARDKLDKAMGKGNREAAERKAEQLEKDLQSGDPKKQDAARKEIEDIAKKAAEAQKGAGDETGPKTPAGDGGPKPKGEPAKGQEQKGKQPTSKNGAEGTTPGGDKKSTPEQIDALKNAAKDLNSPDAAKRQAAEKKIDDAIGHEKREELQEAARDLQSGDPDKAEAAKKKLEEMAKGKSGGDKPNPNPTGPGAPPDRPGDKLKDDPTNRKKTADLQLRTLEEAKKDATLLKKLGYTPEQYDEFLKGYREMLARQEAAKAEDLPKPREAGGPATIKVGGSSGTQPIDKANGATSGGSAGFGTAPPGYSEAQRKFAEEAAKLRKPAGERGQK
jgi:collagen type III alpha